MRNFKSFTLVELVMVMVIIGLLAAIIVPRFTDQRDAAVIASTRANLENLRTALALFYADSGQYPTTAVEFNQWLTGAASPPGLSDKEYIRAIPEENITAGGDNTVHDTRTCGDSGNADESGWIYEYDAGPPQTTNLCLNNSGDDGTGTNYEDY